jgi:transcriptional regulator with XRE-family HTH domain
MTTTQPADESVELGNLLGRRLRDRRRELGRTLADLGSVAGISVGHASSIEKGTSLPSLPVLARIAHALELTLAEVLRASASPRIAEGRIDAPPASARLSPDGSRIQIVRDRLRGESAGSPPFPLAGDDVFVFVHEGAVAIEVSAEQHELLSGDSIHCRSPRTLGWNTASSTGATVIWVTRAGPAGRRGDPAAAD